MGDFTGTGGATSGQGMDSAHENIEIDIRLLGHFEVRIGRKIVTPLSDRNNKVLALLALNSGSLVPLERIIEFTWDDPPSTVRQQIQNIVSSLRRTVAPAGGQAT